MTAETMNDILHPGREPDPEFPHAPENWTRDFAREQAKAEGLELGDDHWEVIRALQEYWHEHDEGHEVKLRELHDALDEKFHAKGGLKYLYGILPGGPVAQGCRLAGLEPPPGAVEPGFGSVV